nr:MAG TPA: DNA methyltransferase [Caudoviricetes sp.]
MEDIVFTEPFALDEQNSCIRHETIGCLTTDGSSPKHNNRIVEPGLSKYRVRKLTEKECGRLMGVKDEDIARIGRNLSRSAQYHCFGDSIVTTCLMAIFGQMTDIDYEGKIEETVKEICKER